MKTKITRGKTVNVVRFTDIEPGTFFSYKGEDFIRVPTVYRPAAGGDVNGINISNGMTWCFAGDEIITPITEVVLYS